MQSNLNEAQVNDLTKIIYEALMQNEDYGLGEMADCQYEAERLTNKWIKNNNIKIIN